MSLLALAACGPVIPGADPGEDTGSATNPTDPTDPTDPSGNSSPTEPVECEQNDDCQGYGYSCINGFCEYECLGCCGAQVDEGDVFRCSEPWYECYSDDECAPGYACDEWGSCVEDPTPDCDALPMFSGELVVSFAEGGPVTELAYARLGDAVGEQLVAVHGDAVVLAAVDGGTVLIQTEGPILDLLAADVDGDGLGDLVVATGGEAPAVSVWRGIAGGLDVAPIASVPMLATSLALGDWQGDGLPDVFARTDAGIEGLLGQGGGALASAVVLMPGPIDAMAILDVEPDGRSDLAARTGIGYALTLGVDGQSRELQAPLGPDGGLALHAADFDGDALADVVTVRLDYEVIAWRGPILEGIPPSTAARGGRAVTSTSADIDADGRADLVVARDDGALSILYGASPAGGEFLGGEPFGCESVFGTPVFASLVATGDHDGDGLRDIAVSDGTTVHVMRR